MILNIIEIIIVLLGIALTPVLFYHFPRIAPVTNSPSDTNLSVIIPVRNEEANLGQLLRDLHHQSCPANEIICVDDDSSDATAQIARSFGVRIMTLKNKPAEWTGKTWACHHGATLATNETLLFLDADVRLGKDALKRLLHTHEEKKCPISVQPYHITEKWYEQGSIIFNLLQSRPMERHCRHLKVLGYMGRSYSYLDLTTNRLAVMKVCANASLRTWLWQNA